jgi:glucan phosphoethanolaminetransferase (alkaline phosphatase superfamily)
VRPLIEDRSRWWRAVWLAAALVTCLVAFESWALGIPDGKDFAAPVSVRASATRAPRLAGMFMIATAQGVFFWASFRSSRRWQALYFFLFASATFVEYGYLRITGALTTAHDILIALENMRYWRSAATGSVNWWAAVPVATYATALIASRSASGSSFRRFVVVACGTMLVHTAYAGGWEPRRPLDDHLRIVAPPRIIAAQALARSATMYAWSEIVAPRARPPRGALDYRVAATPARHVVLVIDETVRADHLSVNGYRRPTTPWLDELQTARRLTNWGVAASATGESANSILCLLTGVTALPDFEHRALTQPTVFQFAKAMNYRTHFFDGQENGVRYGLSRSDLRYIDDWRNDIVFGNDPETDFRIAAALAPILGESAGQFVVVLKRGNHYPFTINYPPGAAAWPVRSDVAESSRDETAAIIDAYDNGLHYNVDRFFRMLLRPDGTFPRTVILYTSDHAEVLREEGRRLPAWQSFAVPLLMFGEDRPDVDVAYRASHVNVFPTLLDLMGVPGAPRPAAYGRSLLSARGSDRDRRLVLYGSLFGTDGFQVDDFDTLAHPSITPRPP